LTNYNTGQGQQSMGEMDSFINATGAKLWINHNAIQSDMILWSPLFIE
jgi:hypothetical protein